MRKQETRLTARRMGNYLMLAGSIQGKPLKLIVDSGANAHAFDQKTAERLSLVGPDAVEVQNGGAGAHVAAKLFSLAGITLGDVALAESRVVAVPFPDELGADAVLDYPLFAQFVVGLDYASSAVTLSAPETFSPPKGAVVLPIRLQNGLAFVETQIDGRKTWLEIDTGDGGTATLNAPFVTKNRLVDAYPKALRLPTGKSVGGLTYGRVARARELRLGPFVFPKPTIVLSESGQGAEANAGIDGRIGAEILSRFMVYFDYKRQRLLLIPNKAQRNPFVFNRAGLLISRNGNTRSVLAVIPGSPAAEAGVTEGEIVLAVDDQEIGRLGDYAVRERLRGPVGSSLSLLLGTSERPQKVVLKLRELL